MNMSIIKKQTNKGEVLFYLEEMIRMDLHDEFEEEMYELLSRGYKLHREDKLELVSRMQEWYDEKF